MALWTLDSSNLKGIEYLPELRILLVVFVKGAVWEYGDVPDAVYREFRDAPSPGKFYASRIKGQYPARKVEDNATD
jgi:hypothetical protein